MEEFMNIEAYLNRNYFDTQRGKHKTVKILNNQNNSIIFETEDNDLLKIRIEKENIIDYRERLEWLQNTVSGNKLDNIIALPTGVLKGLRYNEVGYVSEVGFENLLKDYMKPVKGEKLFKWYFDKTGGIEFRLELGIELAEALSKIHNEGYCYVDISPDGISVTSYKNRVKKPAIKFIYPDNLSSYMKHPISLGKDRYIDPLVNRGMAGNSVISDTYSYAIVLFELLTLQHPFVGEQCDGLDDKEITEKINDGNYDYIDDDLSDNFNEEFEETKFFMPENLKVLFSRMFGIGKLSIFKRPNLLEFKEACEKAKKDLICCTNSACSRTYAYNELHKCPFCNRVTELIITVTSKRIISSNKEILLPHGEFDKFTALPEVEEVIDTMNLKPGINRITRKFFDKSINNEDEILLLKLNLDSGKIVVRNKFKKIKIKVVAGRKIMEPYSNEQPATKSDYGFQIGTTKVIELEENVSLLDEEKLDLMTKEYGFLSHKYVLEIK